MCIGILRVSVYQTCLVPTQAKRGHWVPGPEVTDNGELPCGRRESNPGTLREQSVPLTSKPALSNSTTKLFFVF